ncbi:MAG: DUF2182 domain-containing protein [Actinomycetes bacterium]
MSLPASVLLMVAALAWVLVATLSRGMAHMPGAMGMSLLGFVAMWVLMMTAMMLPTIGPFVTLYTRTYAEHRALRATMLALGYLVVWGAAGVPAYLVAALGEHLAADRPSAATALAVGIFLVCGVYQFSPFKDRCLSHCRSPLGDLVRYGAYKGAGRDLRVGVIHGGYCLGCCWPLMAVLVAVGLMNLLAMGLIVVAVLVEKYSWWGERFSRAVGVAALILGVLVIARPELAGGLYQTPDDSMSQESTGGM